MKTACIIWLFLVFGGGVCLCIHGLIYQPEKRAGALIVVAALTGVFLTGHALAYLETDSRNKS